MVSKDEARKELARRELARRRGQSQQQADQPWYDELGQAANDILRLGSNAVTFGFRDKLAPYLTGNTVDEERALTAEARERAGSAGLAAELLGGAAVPMGAASVGLTAMKAVPSGMIGARGLAARTGAMAGEGALYGGLSALGNDQDVLTGMGYGAAGGAAGNLVGEGISAAVSKVAGNPRPNIPGMSELNAAKEAAYNRADQAGVAFTPKAVERIQQKAADALTEIGYDPALQPGASVALRRIQDLQGQNVTLTGLETIRKIASNGYIPGNKSNNKAISEIIDAIDDVVTNPQSADVLMGDQAAGAAALREARSLASRAAKLSRVDEAVSKADLRAASTGSGGNVDNATRQNLRRILENPRGFTPDEREALETVVRGTRGQNALRLAGKLSPSGNGLMAALGITGTMVNPMIGAASLGGMGAKAAADSITQRNVNRVAELIAAGGSRSALEAPKSVAQLLAEEKRESIARALMGMAVSQTVPAR